MKQWLCISICFLALIGLASAKSFSKIKREFYRDYQSPDYAKRMEAVQKLAETGRLEALKLLVKVVLPKERDQYVYEETLQFIKEKFTAPECIAYLGRQLASGNWKVQLSLCRIAGDLREEPILKGLLKALNSSKWQVRSMAVRALRSHRSKEAVDGLIQRLKKERHDRVKGDITAALEKLTGQKLGTDPRSWQSWWEQAKSSFDPDQISTTSEGHSGPMKLRTVLRKGGFYGTIVSTRVVFILDISGSMLEGTEAGKRIDVAKKQLIQALEQLPKKAKFNILAFNHEVKPWKRKMVSASSSNKRKAIQWIQRLTLDPNGMTATYDALEYVFLRDREADTIYFLSDGTPTTGKFTGQEQILSKIRELNRFRNLTIHTIAFLAGGSPGEDKQSAAMFMKDLAKQNGGKFKHIE